MDELSDIKAWCEQIQAQGMTKIAAPAIGWLENCVGEITRLRAENERLKIAASETAVDEVEEHFRALERQLAAKQTELEAWFSVFGTTQLSHAQARLEAVERWVTIREMELKTLQDTLVNVYAELAASEKRCGEMEKALNKIASKSKCECWELVPMGSGRSPKWIGCEIHRSSCPNEWCLCCIAHDALKEPSHDRRIR